MFCQCFAYKVKIQRLYKVAWPRKNIKLDVGFWGYLWTCRMTIKWDAEHPDSNTCAEQWHYKVDFQLNNDRCSSDDFLNRVDGSIDMIVYKVEGPRSNFGGILSISSMGNPKDSEWLRNRTKPTARQISIPKSLTESMVKQNQCWTGHFIPPPPTENASNTLSFQRGPWEERGPPRAARQNGFNFETLLARTRARARARGAPRTAITLRTPFKGNLHLYKVAGPGKTPEKSHFYLDWPLYRSILCRSKGYKVASPGKNDFFQGFCLDWPLYRGILCRSKGECLYKVASPGKNDFFQGFYLDWPLYRGILCRSKGYKVASPSKYDFFQGFYLEPLYRGILCWGRGYKVASPGKIVFFSAVLPGLATL